MARVGVIGAGSWGTALAKVLHTNGNDVVVWSIVEAEIRMLNDYHEHLEKLPGVRLPKDMKFTTDMKEAVDDVENKTAEISDDVEKELTVGEMFKNRKFINDNIPQTRPRADVVLINEEIKVATPEKYSFK